MSVRAGREFLAIPGPTTVPDEVLRAMHRPAVDIYSGPLLALTDGLQLRASDFSPRLLAGHTAGAGAPALSPAIPTKGTLQERLDAIEAMVLREVMLRLRWNKTQAAKELGLSRVGLRAKLLRFGLETK